MKLHSIVINAIPLLSEFTGIAKYTYEISRRIARLEWSCDPAFYYGYFRKKLYDPAFVARSSEVAAVRRIKKFLSRFEVVKRFARAGIHCSNRLLKRQWDFYWEPNYVPVRQIRSKHLVATVHDFSFHLYPEWHPEDRKEYFRKNFWKSIGHSDRIITGSHFTKSEILDLLNVDSSRVQVIYHGVDHENFKVYSRHELQAFADLNKLPEKFVLFVGSIEPRKNLTNALRAYNSLPDDFKREHKFVLAGFSGWENREVMDIIGRENGNILYLGYLSDRELAGLYNLATAFIYPSLYEGFGLPPLEAMACGTPVIVSRAASMPEICGDAAYYVDPSDMKDISEGIYTVIHNDNLRNDLIRRGLQKSHAYTWDQSAKQHVKVFQEVMNS